MDVTAALRGLSVKAQAKLLKDSLAISEPSLAPDGTKAEEAGTGESGSGPGERVLPSLSRTYQQEHASSILEPCDIRVTVKASERVQDVNVSMDELQLRMSPDVLQLLQHLAQVC
jgi:hypothetical protein